MIPFFTIVGHDEAYFEERGASREEIGIVLATGEIAQGYAGRYIARGIFTDGYERPRGIFPHKEVRVVFAIRDWGIAVVTVIVRFGTWEEPQ